MLRPSLAVLAALLLTGLVATPAFAQSGPGGPGGPGGGGYGGGGGRSGGGGHRGDEGGSEHGERPAPAVAAETAAEEQARQQAVAKAKAGSELLDSVVAIVNDGVVTESELDNELADITKQLTQNNVKLPAADELRGKVLDRLVMQELQMQRADHIGLKVSDEQLNASIAQTAKDNKLTLQQLPDVLKAQGLDYASFRDDRRKQIMLAMLQQKEVVSKINVTPRELDQFMERLKKQPDENAEYDVSDILIALPSEATQAQVDEMSKKAQDIYARTATEDFARLAVTNSQAQSALQGGALGWLPRPNLPTWSTETVPGMKAGEISKPIATPYGFHIVKLNAIRHTKGDPVQDQVHVRHILIKPDTLQDDATVRLKLVGVRQRILNGEDFAAFAASMSQDSGSSVSGGDLDWKSLDDFVPEFAQAITGLKDGEISEPFQTQFGWHIVQLLGRRKFDTTEDNLRDRAFRQLRDSKTDEETESWLREMRDEAYIDTKL